MYKEQYSKYKILIVDDEMNILNSIKRSMRKEPLNLEFANSGAEAIAKLESMDFGVVITDMRMPDYDGLDVLRAAAKLHPQATRIILSGYSEKESLMSAINEGNVWRFLVKPWEFSELILTIQNALELYDEKQQKKVLVRELAQKNKELGTLNENLESLVFQRTMELNTRSMVLKLLVEADSPEDAWQELLNNLKRIVKANIFEWTESKEKVMAPVENNGEFIGGFICEDDKVILAKDVCSQFHSLLCLVHSHKKLLSEDDITNIDSFLEGMD